MTGPDMSLESAAYVLYVAQREVDSIPYTAPEALVDRLRQVVPLAQELLERLREAGRKPCPAPNRHLPHVWYDRTRTELPFEFACPGADLTPPEGGQT